jgi:hypothetical protein
MMAVSAAIFASLVLTHEFFSSEKRNKINDLENYNRKGGKKWSRKTKETKMSQKKKQCSKETR